VSIARFAPVAAGGALVVGLLGLSSWVPQIATAAAPLVDRASIAPLPELPQVAVRYVASGPGNKARYRVRERLLGKELDNDAVGETSTITGSIALDAQGAIVRTGSGFSVEMAGLKSDQSRRDNYVRNRLLATDSFPTTRFAITSVRGLPSPLPTSGKVQFQLLGDLTVKGVTRPTTWSVSADVSGDRLTGKASTLFTFAQFQLTQPKVRIVLSVNDTIRLEYDFAMQKQAP
jgi:polyisoprenoid-binding protein YceI